jgi:phage terminase small subunit
MRELAPKQQRFVEEYLVDLNATAAYKRAGYVAKGNAAEVSASQLLRNPKVADAIHIMKSQRASRTEVTADWVLKTLSEEKKADLADLFEEDGSLKPVKKWPMVWRQGLVVGVESFEEFAGQGAEREQIGWVKKLKLSDRIKHLELIGRHVDVQAWRDQKAVTGPNGEPLTMINIDLSSASPEQLRALASLKITTNASV